jgi:beta-phosphoglucomutase-like phosphatase (HAD superfamily)
MSVPPSNRPLPDLSKIKAVLFDVDGTLTNSDPLHFKAFREILVQYGYKARPAAQSVLVTRRWWHGMHAGMHAEPGRAEGRTGRCGSVGGACQGR